MKLSVSLLFFIISLPLYAFHWVDLWRTPDQQGQQWMEKGQFHEAEKHFSAPDWKASAAYRAKDYEVASKRFEGLKTDNGYYNQGNALAQLNRYQEAIKAYDKALHLNPNNKDAQFNRQLIADLLKSDQKQSPNQEQKQQDEKNNQDNENKQDSQDKQEQQNQPSDQTQPNSASPDDSNSEKNQPEEKPEKKDDLNSKKEDEKQSSESEQSEQQDPAEASSEPKKSDQTNPSTGKLDSEAPSPSLDEQEKQQAKKQWLRLIPDDPGGLLRQKFLRDYRRRQQGGE